MNAMPPNQALPSNALSKQLRLAAYLRIKPYLGAEHATLQYGVVMGIGHADNHSHTRGKHAWLQQQKDTHIDFAFVVLLSGSQCLLKTAPGMLMTIT
jgi:hypothetical protein